MSWNSGYTVFCGIIIQQWFHNVLWNNDTIGNGLLRKNNALLFIFSEFSVNIGYSGTATVVSNQI